MTKEYSKYKSSILIALLTFISIGVSLVRAEPPFMAHHPYPADSAITVERTLLLEWLGGDPDGDETSYDIYFGTDANPPLVADNWPGNYYNPLTELETALEAGTTYYWQIISEDSNGESTVGETWSFTTQFQSDLERWEGNPVVDDWYGIGKIYLEDIDGDGDIDIVGGTLLGSSVRWVENTGNGTYITHGVDFGSPTTTSVFPVDLDSDGDMDILGSIAGQGILRWWENDGEQNFNSHHFAFPVLDPTKIMAADFDNDGDVDVIASSYEMGNIKIWENNGNQSFVVRNVVTVFPGAVDFDIGDIDNDGDVDVIGASYDNNLIRWFENNGANNFIIHTIANTFTEVISVSLADFDSDGDLDFAAASQYHDAISYFENDGNQEFTELTTINNLDGIGSIEAVDIDGDADTDILCAAFNDNSIVCCYNDGSQNFETIILSDNHAGAVDISAGDMDNDGDLEIVASAAYSSMITCWTGGPNQHPLPATLSNPPDNSTDITTRPTFSWSSEDPDNDELFYELLLSTNNPPVNSVISGIRMSEWSLSTPLNNLETYYWQVIARDRWGDLSASDIFAFTTSANSPPALPYNIFPPDNSTNTDRNVILSWESWDPELTDVTYDIYFGTNPNPPLIMEDIPVNYFYPYEDGNPLQENATYYWQVKAVDASGIFSVTPVMNFTTTLSNTFNRFQFNEHFANGIRSNGIQSIDFDNDGDNDLIYSALNNIYLLENTGDLDFTGHEISSVHFSSEFVKALDFDLDGDNDIIGYNRTTNQIMCWINFNLEFDEYFVIANYDNAGDLEILDYDYDGDSDILISSPDLNYLTLYENIGNNSFEPTNIIVQQNNIQGFEVFDDSNDGDYDIVIMSEGENELQLYNMQNNGEFLSREITDLDRTFLDMKTADLNLDGQMDLVLSDYNNRVFWLENGSQTHFDVHLINSGSPQISQIHICELNNDGYCDIIGINSENDKALVWYSDDSEEFLPDAILYDDEISILTTADLDGDGVSEIITSSSNSATSSIFTQDNNIPPAYPQLFMPRTGDNEVSINPTFHWLCEDEQGDRVQYFISLEAIDTGEQTIESTLSTLWAPDFDLEYMTEYSWFIQAVDQWNGESCSNPRTFITTNHLSIDHPSPLNGSVGVERTTMFQWTGSNDIADVEAEYDIFFSTSTTYRPLLLNHHFGNFLNPYVVLDETLEFNTTYYWNVVTQDSENDYISGPLWSFTTMLPYEIDEYDFNSIQSNLPGIKDVVSYDYDFDGDIDIVGASHSINQLSLWRNSNNTFNHEIISEDIAGITSIQHLDYEEDGDIDLFVSSDYSNQIFWLEKTDHQNYSNHPLFFYTNPQKIEVIDFDYDNDFDVIIANPGSIDLKVKNNELHFENINISNDFTDISDIEVVDIDGDGDLDVIASSSTSHEYRCFENNGELEFTNHLIYQGTHGGKALAISDIDLDGDMDLIGSGSHILWIENNLEMGYTVHTVGNPVNDILDVGSADLDGDGDVDIYATSETSNIVWRENNGNQIFTSHFIINSALVASSINHVDLDGDLDFDLLVSSEIDNELAYLDCQSIALYNPPLPFNLISPADGSIIENSEEFPLTFHWELTTDPDPGDDITYTLEIANNDLFENALTYDEIETDSFRIIQLDINGYFWRVKAVDNVNLHTYSNQVFSLNISLDVEEVKKLMPVEYALDKVYPNPFNPSLNIVVAIPARSELQLSIFNILGQRVATLADGSVNTGFHNFTFDGSNLGSGVYFVQAIVPGQLNQMQKVILLK